MNTLQEAPPGSVSTGSAMLSVCDGLIAMPAPPMFRKRIPPEVLLVIAGFCRDADLAVMARSSPTLQSIAEFELYHSVTDSVFEYDQLIGCLHTIITRPRIADMVRSIDIEDEHHEQPSGQAYLNLLARVLPLVKRIVTLRLPADLPPGPFLTAHCLGMISPNRTLQRLSGPEWLVADEIIGSDERLEFLSVQTNLITLELLDIVEFPETLAEVVIPSASRLCLPKLGRLMISAFLLPYVLKSDIKEVQYLEVDAQDGVRIYHSVVPTKLARLLGMRIRLWAEIAGETLMDLAHYLHHFPSIITLEIEVLNGFESQANTKDFLHTLATFMEAFPNLLALYFNPISLKLVGLQNLRILANHCPTLRQVTFCNKQLGIRRALRIGVFWTITNTIHGVNTVRMALPPGVRAPVDIREAVGTNEWELAQSDVKHILEVQVGWED